MSGHSKWATIKHKKAALDAKRGKLFTRIIKEITIAARNGGDPDSNPRLRTAIMAAKAVSMPADNIKRAIQRGTGEIEGGAIEEVMFEGYGPGGVAIMVAAATDNRNRTVSEIRHLFSKHGGNLGELGSVSWMFERKSQVLIEKDKATEERLMEIALEAGADDVKLEGEHWEILSAPEAHHAVLEALEKAGIPTASAEIGMIPKSLMEVDPKHLPGVMKLLEALEDHDDVQNVYTNADLGDETGE
ncbi:MAG: YebC/PmpR family DNA-binding transcriptional regulator [Bryobacteraceae bacterium]